MSDQAAAPKAKYMNIGKILLRKDGSGQFLPLGENNEKRPEYNCTVELRVKDASGKVVFQQVNPIISVREASEEIQAKFPSLVASLSVKLD